VCTANKSDVLCPQYIIDNCFRNIFNVKLSDTVHECEIEFGLLPMSDVNNIKKKCISLSIASPITFYANFVNNGKHFVRFTVSDFSLVKFSFSCIINSLNFFTTGLQLIKVVKFCWRHIRPHENVYTVSQKLEVMISKYIAVCQPTSYAAPSWTQAAACLCANCADCQSAEKSCRRLPGA